MNFNLLKQEIDTSARTEKDRSIAVIGLGARIGEYESVGEIWEALRACRDFVRSFPAGRMDDASRFHELMSGEALSESVLSSAYLEHIDRFDAEFFQIAGAEAELMDPHHRIFLETAWHALEDGGVTMEALRGSRTGVYAGFNTLGEEYLSGIAREGEHYGIALSGNIHSMLSSRLSYFLDLKGPSLLVDTACSSSLVAVHLACEALLRGEIDLAIVGGVKVSLVPRLMEESKLGIESSTQRTRSFDREADGTGGGEGAVVMVLRRMEDAERAQDPIYARLLASTVNQDGSSIGITAPHAGAQSRLIQSCWKKAHIEPEDLGYVEAHGTATPLGDPAEIKGLTDAFTNYSDRKQICAIGSIKSNAGHLDCVAGIAGLMKLVLMVHKGEKVPTLHFQSPNPKLDFIGSPFYVNDILRKWPSPRIGGVSSFGLSGTNAHVLVSEVRPSLRPLKRETSEILCFSAHKLQVLYRQMEQLQRWVADNPEIHISNLAYTLSRKRSTLSHRIALVAENLRDFLELDLGEIFAKIRRGESLPAGKLYYGFSREMTAPNAEENETHDVSVLAHQFARGIQIDWEGYFHRESYTTLRLPPYPFDGARHWIDPSAMRQPLQRKVQPIHPLLHEPVFYGDQARGFRTVFSVEEFWLLSEHRIGGYGVLPGTAFIEMALAAGAQYFSHTNLEMENLVYLAPMRCKPGEAVTVFTSLTEKDGLAQITFQSEEGRQIYCRAELRAFRPQRGEKREIAAIIASMEEVRERPEKTLSVVEIGGFHWRDNLRHGYTDGQDILLEMALAPSLREDARQYRLYPSILDQALSSGHYFSKDHYIPYGFKRAVFPPVLPAEFYSYIRRRRGQEPEDDILAVYDIELMDMAGRCIGFVEEYLLKKLEDPTRVLSQEDLTKQIFHRISWTLQKNRAPRESHSAQPDIILTTPGWESFLSLWPGACTTSLDSWNSADRRDKVVWICVDQSDRGVDGIGPYFELLEKAMRQEDFAGREFIFFTKGALPPGDANIAPFAAAVAALAMNVGDECVNVSTRHLDIDDSVTSAQILDELRREKTSYAVALRRDGRYTAVLETVDGKPEAEDPFASLAEQSCLLIGGTGGMGRAIARHLAEIYPKIHFYIVSRHGAKESLIQAFGTLKNVSFLQSDVAKREDVLKLRKVIGGPAGLIVHLAGVPSEGMMINKEWSSVASVLEAKMTGSRLLLEVFPEQETPIVFFSSLSSVFGAPGQSDYCAANQYIAALSRAVNATGRPASVLYWTGWKESGMAKRGGIRGEDSYVRFVSDAEGVEAFCRALRQREKSLLVGQIYPPAYARNLERLEQHIQLEPNLRTLVERYRETRIESVEHLNILGREPEELTEIEKNILCIWANILGVETVGIDDVFFEVGGNSLLASVFQREIHKIYPSAMSVADIFVHSTPEKIAEHIRRQIHPEIPEEKEIDDDIEALVDQLLSGHIDRQAAIAKLDTAEPTRERGSSR